MSPQPQGLEVQLIQALGDGTPWEWQSLGIALCYLGLLSILENV